jgi:hypothetical protein
MLSGLKSGRSRACVEWARVCVGRTTLIRELFNSLEQTKRPETCRNESTTESMSIF